MNADSRFRPSHAWMGLPVLFALFALAPVDAEAAPTQSKSAQARNVIAAKKALAKKKASNTRNSKHKKSALSKAIKKHHNHHHRHHQHKHHHKHKKHHTHKKTNASASNAGVEKRLEQDIARLESDEKTLTRDTSRLRKILK